MHRVAPLALAAMFVAACGDRNPTATAPTDPASFVISDGNNSGNGDFFFLPPLVPNPSGAEGFEPEAFNAGVRPVVIICALDAAKACVGTFRTFHGAEVELSAAEELYKVHWDTDEKALDLNTIYRISVWIGATVRNDVAEGGIRLGFADVDPVTNQGQLKNYNTGDDIPLVDGRTLPIKFRIESGASCGGSTTCAEKTFTDEGGILTMKQKETEVTIAGISVLEFSIPTLAKEAGVTEVLLKLEEVPIGDAATGDVSASAAQTSARASCHPQLRAIFQDGRCIRFTTVPDLEQYASGVDETGNLVIFEKPITIGICPLIPPDHPMFERLDPYRSLDHGEDTKPTRLEVVAAPFLPCDPTAVAQREPRPEGILGYASAGWRAVTGGIARLLTPRNAYAFDLGVGALTRRHSFYGFAATGTADGEAALDEYYTPGTVVQVAVRLESVGAHEHDGESTLPRPAGGVSVLMTVEEGGGTLGPAALPSLPVVTDPVTGIAMVDWTLGASGSQRLVATVGTLETPVTFSTTIAAFFDGLDAAEGAWSQSGFWNRNTLVGVTNLGQNVYVTLPDDGALPQVFGERAYWYGVPSLGNYLGTRLTGDGALSGGTSNARNSGSVTSPQFHVPASSHGTVLRFDTWFEIEGVNPATFDLMTVSVIQGAGVLEIRKLNPTSDPAVNENRAARPFGSGGYNVAPVWQPVELDMTAYEGSDIQLRFAFDTRDLSYNGFRGWVVDNVRVVPKSAPSPAAFNVLSSGGGGLPLNPVGELPASRPTP